MNAIMNNVVAAKTMTAPEDKLCSKLIYNPITDDKEPKKEDSNIITQNRFVNR